MGLYVDCTRLEHSILKVKYVMHNILLGQSKQCFWNEYGSFRVKSTNGGTGHLSDLAEIYF